MYTAPSSTSREDAENDELACLSAGIAGSCRALCQNMPGDHQAPGLPGGCLAAWPTLTAPLEPSPSAKGSLRWCSKSPFKTKDNTGFAARQPAWPALADLTSKPKMFIFQRWPSSCRAHKPVPSTPARPQDPNPGLLPCPHRHMRLRLPKLLMRQEFRPEPLRNPFLQTDTFRFQKLQDGMNQTST